MARYSGPIIDVDIHNKWKRDADILQYLPKHWREYAEGQGVAPMPIRPPNVTSASMLENAARLAEAFPADGTYPGSDYGLLKEQLLDKYGYWRGILTHDLGEYGQHLNGYFGVELCRAANEWNVEHWLAKDERLYSVIAVPSSAPEEAAKEIRRWGGNRRLVSVLLAGNGLGRPYGDPIYDPIHRAAAETGKSIAVHLAVNRPNPLIAMTGGPVSTGIVANSQLSQEAMHYATSFIVHGVFEKYPSLKLLLKEFGTAWLPSVIWGMDRRYELLRFESPWVRRLPSEYFRNHIRLSTQPFEESPEPEQMIQLMETVNGVEEMLCFSSDYPHISFDDPTYIARLMPARWHAKVFFGNACRLYGWDAEAEAAGVLGRERVTA